MSRKCSTSVGFLCAALEYLRLKALEPEHLGLFVALSGDFVDLQILDSICIVIVCALISAYKVILEKTAVTVP